MGDPVGFVPGSESNQHHVLCNFSAGPRAGCKQCDHMIATHPPRIARGARYELPDGRIFLIPDPWYLASCDACGWVGSTEECKPHDEDVICPRCYRGGCDGGAVAESVKETKIEEVELEPTLDRAGAIALCKKIDGGDLNLSGPVFYQSMAICAHHKERIVHEITVNTYRGPCEHDFVVTNKADAEILERAIAG